MVCPENEKVVWKPVVNGAVWETLEEKLLHCPVTLPVICSWLPLVVNILIELVKQQQIVVSHAPSVWNVPIQLGVDEIVPFFMKMKKKSRVINQRKKEIYSFPHMLNLYCVIAVRASEFICGTGWKNLRTRFEVVVSADGDISIL
jgi:hypothetical protein